MSSAGVYGEGSLYFAAWSLWGGSCGLRRGDWRGRAGLRRRLRAIRPGYGLWCGSSLARMLRYGSGRRMWLGGLPREMPGCLSGMRMSWPDCWRRFLRRSRGRGGIWGVVPRVAHTQAQRLRAARTMSLLVEDESNVVRCSAVEGMGLLALQEASLRDEAEEMVESYLRQGTKAMKSRARGGAADVDEKRTQEKIIPAHISGSGVAGSWCRT